MEFKQRILGIDYGDKRIGLAVSDAFGWTAQGLKVVERRFDGREMNEIGQVIADYAVGEVVLGLPKNMNGTLGPRADLSLTFAKQLEDAFGLQVHLVDERLTTVAAERTLLEADVSRKKRKQVVDKMAAAIILQSFLDSRTTK